MNMYMWLGLMIVFLIAEGVCAIHLVSIWFAAGALVAAVTDMLGGPLWLQITLFLAVSGGLLAALWPVTKRFLKPKLSKTNIDSIIGFECYVLTDIDNTNATGQVKLNGMEWTARSTAGKCIPAGTLVKVDTIEGVKVFVSQVEKGEVE